MYGMSGYGLNKRTVLTYNMEILLVKVFFTIANQIVHEISDK